MLNDAKPPQFVVEQVVGILSCLHFIGNVGSVFVFAPEQRHDTSLITGFLDGSGNSCDLVHKVLWPPKTHMVGYTRYCIAPPMWSPGVAAKPWLTMRAKPRRTLTI